MEQVTMQPLCTDKMKIARELLDFGVLGEASRLRMPRRLRSLASLHSDGRGPVAVSQEKQVVPKR